MPQLTVDVGHKIYPLYIASSGLAFAGQYIKKAFPKSKAVIITDVNVFALYHKVIEDSFIANDIVFESIVLPAGEATKSFTQLLSVYETLVDMEIQKSDVIVAFGGGVIGDLAGFAAASYLRGIGLVQIPTTLLSQIDSAIGGKVAVNMDKGKNLVGAFYHPSLVVIDTDVLHTLNDDDFASGMAEVIKTGAILDATLFETIRKNPSRNQMMQVIDDVIFRCCEIKRDIVQQDELDNGIRMLLNFGHTLAHAIEKMPNNIYTHGQAVSIGMVQFAQLGEKMGLTQKGTAQRIKDVVTSFSLPYEIIAPHAQLLDIMKHDKKIRQGQLHLILLKEIGNAFIHQIPLEQIGELL